MVLVRRLIPTAARQKMSSDLRAGLRRTSLGVLDQTLSSGTNFALGIFVAAVVGARQFGAFSLVYAWYGASVGVSAGLASSPLLVRFSGVPADEFQNAERDALGTALSTGLVSSILC